MEYQGFVGGSNTLQNVVQSVERSVNWMPEATQPGAGPPGLVPTPGLRHYITLGAGPIRALFWQDGRVFAVGGAQFYELFSSQTFLYRGAVEDDGRQATICSNGTAGFQLFIVSAGHGYIFNLSTNTFAEITDPDFPRPCAMGLFVDGYFVALKAHSRSFSISALEDGTDWDPLDVFEISEASDDVVALVGGMSAHRELWLIGSKTTEVWADLGDPLIPFQPIPGTLIQQGTVAEFSPACLDNTVYWLGQNDLGFGVVYKAQGYSPARTSTTAAELAVLRAPRLDDAIGWAYQQDGHLFYGLYVPSMRTTWVYDVSTNVWHERARWNSIYMRYEPHRARSVSFGFNRILVGDRNSPGVYSWEIDKFDDDVVGA